MSQQALSHAAEVSTRHLSFLETGKAQPSRQMVLVLASALEIPLRERNALLTSAGFAAAYGARDFGDPDMHEVRRVRDFVLQRAEPNPALAVDRHWRIHAMNQGAQRMAAFFIDPDPEVLAFMDQAMHLIFHPKGLRRYIVNWPAVATVTLDRLRAEAPQDPVVAQLLSELEAYPPTPRPQLAPGDQVLIPVHLRKAGVELRFATLLTTLGTPMDATAQDLTIETYFPLDAATEAWILG